MAATGAPRRHASPTALKIKWLAETRTMQLDLKLLVRKLASVSIGKIQHAKKSKKHVFFSFPGLHLLCEVRWVPGELQS